MSRWNSDLENKNCSIYLQCLTVFIFVHCSVWGVFLRIRFYLMENVSADKISFNLNHIRYFMRANMEVMN